MTPCCRPMAATVAQVQCRALLAELHRGFTVGPHTPTKIKPWSVCCQQHSTLAVSVSKSREARAHSAEHICVSASQGHHLQERLQHWVPHVNHGTKVSTQHPAVHITHQPSHHAIPSRHPIIPSCTAAHSVLRAARCLRGPPQFLPAEQSTAISSTSRIAHAGPARSLAQLAC
jgi:hypothetical protein